MQMYVQDHVMPMQINAKVSICIEKDTKNQLVSVFSKLMLLEETVILNLIAIFLLMEIQHQKTTTWSKVNVDSPKTSKCKAIAFS
jgi:hypothetical protein